MANSILFKNIVENIFPAMFSMMWVVNLLPQNPKF